MADRRCKATTKLGKRCGKPSVEDGLCLVHAGKQNMAEIGAKGGRGRTRSMLGIDDSVADDKLRAKAKARLEEMLDSTDESKRLAAARALYSYQAQKPPNESEQNAGGWQHQHKGVPSDIPAHWHRRAATPEARMHEP